MISPLTLAATTTLARPLEMDSATWRPLVPSGYSLTVPSGRVTFTDIRGWNPTGTLGGSQDGDGAGRRGLGRSEWGSRHHTLEPGKLRKVRNQWFPRRCFDPGFIQFQRTHGSLPC